MLEAYSIIASLFFPLIALFAWAAFQSYREASRLLEIYAPEVAAEFKKPKHKRGPYPEIVYTKEGPTIRTPYKSARKRGDNR